MDGRGWRTGIRPAALAAVLAVTCSAVVACSAGRPSSPGPGLRGQKLEVAAVWSGVEQRHFELVLRAFTRQTGVSVTYTSAGYGVPAFLTARLAEGRPPDVAFLPQPGLLRTYAAEHRLVPLDGIAGSVVADNYGPAWRRLARSGVPAFAVGGRDGWTLADWFSNLYLRLAGPARYDLLAAHKIAWTDPSVITTLRLLATVLDPRVIAGGPREAVATSYQESVQQAFASRPAAAMVFEGDFVAGIIDGATRAVLGVDADAFPFPAIGQPGPMVVAGGDAAVLMRRSPAGDAFIRFLAGPQAGAIWAAAGGFVSPNVNVGLSVYPDAISRSIAAGLLQAGDNFRFSLSDLTPAGFGGTEAQGMRKILRQFLVSRDVSGTAAELEQAAGKAYPP